MQCPTLSEDKLKHVASKVRRESSRSRMVSPKMVACVLRNPPANRQRITRAEIDTINGKLIIPLHLKTIQEILAVAEEYDKLIVRTTDTDKKNATFAADYRTPYRVAV